MRIADPTAAVRYLAAHPADRILIFDEEIAGAFFWEIRHPQHRNAPVVTIGRDTWIEMVVRGWIARAGRYPHRTGTRPDGTDATVYMTIFRLTTAGRSVGRTPQESRA